VGPGVPVGARGRDALGDLARACGTALIGGRNLGVNALRSGKVMEPVMMQKVLEAHVRAQLDSLAEVRIDLR